MHGSGENALASAFPGAACREIALDGAWNNSRQKFDLEY